jgi:THO complex subunit 1
MAVPDVVSQSSAVAALDDLLRRAHSAKPTTSIDPPLQVSELVSENEVLFGELQGDKDMRAVAVESAAKSVFYANLVSFFGIADLDWSS